MTQIDEDQARESVEIDVVKGILIGGADPDIKCELGPIREAK